MARGSLFQKLVGMPHRHGSYPRLCRLHIFSSGEPTPARPLDLPAPTLRISHLRWPLEAVWIGPSNPTQTCAFCNWIICGPMLLERSEEHTSELQSRFDLVCRLLLEKKKS